MSYHYDSPGSAVHDIVATLTPCDMNEIAEVVDMVKLAHDWGFVAVERSLLWGFRMESLINPVTHSRCESYETVVVLFALILSFFACLVKELAHDKALTALLDVISDIEKQPGNKSYMELVDTYDCLRRKQRSVGLFNLHVFRICLLTSFVYFRFFHVPLGGDET